MSSCAKMPKKSDKPVAGELKSRLKKSTTNGTATSTSSKTSTKWPDGAVIFRRTGRRVAAGRAIYYRPPEPEMSFERYRELTRERHHRELLCQYPGAHLRDEDLVVYQRRCYDHAYLRLLKDWYPFATADAADCIVGETRKGQKVSWNLAIQHTHWCVQCGRVGGKHLSKCEACCASYHAECLDEDLDRRDNSEMDDFTPAELRELQRCPDCLFAPSATTYDLVWHKLKHYPWWPAMIVPFERRPMSLTNAPSPEHVVLRYYATKNFAWAHRRELCKFAIDFSILKTNGNGLAAAIAEAQRESKVEKAEFIDAASRAVCGDVTGENGVTH